MGSATLAIIYNHRYDKNVQVLSELYGESFDDVVHLMPFASPSESVVPIFESSYRFGGYAAQALPRLLQNDSSYYVFVGDDLILNPAITQDTLEEKLGLAGARSGFIKGWEPLGRTSAWWYHLHRGWRPLVDRHSGVEWKGLLPAEAEATERLRRHGYSPSRIGPKNLVTRPPVARSKKAALRSALELIRNGGSISPAYPLAMGYSDVFAMGREALEEFAYFSGVLSSVGVFSEVAVPTALLMACESVATEREAKGTGLELWESPDVVEMEDTFDREIPKLMKGFEDHGWLWVHPVKLSRWQVS